ncbi:MAG: HlyD family efflux transporter periplasmic adaptor subunit [Xenococcaceae cyanobacterium MO_167.B27]|nr:HlyD family efflux transporter periplasmic adaptor subunit [Xenococcaceae cyanobacterium MO_167.B27]
MLEHTNNGTKTAALETKTKVPSPALSLENSEIVTAPKSKRKRSPLLLIPVAFLLAGVGLHTWNVVSSPSNPFLLRVSGRIEGYETDIGAKVGGRIRFVAVHEGDEVTKGQLIARLDDGEIQAQLQGAAARLDAAQQREEEAGLEIDLLETQIQETQLNLQQDIQDAKGRVFEASASVASSTAQLNEAVARLQQAKFELKLAKTNLDRFAQLIAEGAISQRQFDEVQTAFETAQARVQASQASVDSFGQFVNSAQGQLVQAKTAQLNPSIRNSQINRLRTQLRQARLKLAAAKAEVNNVKAAKAEIQSRVSDLNIISPIDGVVTTRIVEPGEVVAGGQPLVTIINPDTVYLRGYVPQGQIGKVKVGQEADLFLDSAPNQALSAKVTAIDTKASFTPENIYFAEDRVKQVFGVKIAIDEPAGLAKPGLPADAEIDLKPKVTDYSALR